MTIGKYIRNKFDLSIWAVFVLLLAASIPMQAEAEDSDSEWDFAAAAYIWGAAMTSTTPGGVETELPFYAILDNLKMTFMGDFAARNAKWTHASDIIYLKVGDSFSGTATGPEGMPIDGNGDIDMKSWIITPTVGYAVYESETTRFELVAGARYLDMEASVQVNTEVMNVINASVSASYWDAIIGLRATFNLAPRWYIPIYFDIGTGDSDGTWQGFAGVGYRFKKFDSILAYRYLDYQFDDNPVMAELTVKGPFLGMVVRF